MNKNITITCGDFPHLRLISATDADREKLRVWKNAHRAGFFYQETIEPKQQEKWFQGYLAREDDYMFMVEGDGVLFGCMAFRLKDNEIVDLYNIIRGEEGSGSAFMRDAMHMMLAYIKQQFPKRKIQCDVLKDNPAVQWYRKCGFAIWEEKEYYIMGIRQEEIPDIQVESKEE